MPIGKGKNKFWKDHSGGIILTVVILVWLVIFAGAIKIDLNRMEEKEAAQAKQEEVAPPTAMDPLVERNQRATDAWSKRWPNFKQLSFTASGDAATDINSLTFKTPEGIVCTAPVKIFDIKDNYTITADFKNTSCETEAAQAAIRTGNWIPAS